MEEPNIIVVHGCNFDCLHCVVSKTCDFSYISINIFKKIIKELSELGFNLIGIIGAGEPTLHPYFDELMRICVRYGIKVDILTNGWFFKEKLVPILEDEYLSKAILRIGFSLDAPREKLHDNIRRKGSFEKIMEAISYAALLEIPVYLKVAIRKSNMHLIDEIIKFGISIGVEQVRFISTMPTERLIKSNDIPSPKTIKYKIMPKLNMLQDISDGYVFWEGWQFDQTSPIFPCNGFSKFDIDWNGYSVFCSMLSKTGTDPFNNEREVSLENCSFVDAISYHFNMLSKIVEWRLKAKELIKSGKYPICYWCYYQFGRISWLTKYPESPWAKGVIEAYTKGIKPMAE